MIDKIISSFQAHPYIWLGSGYVLSNAISAMPSPSGNTGFYRWLFDFSHVIGGNIMRIVKTRCPQLGVITTEQQTMSIQPAGDGVKVATTTKTITANVTEKTQ